MYGYVTSYTHQLRSVAGWSYSKLVINHINLWRKECVWEIYNQGENLDTTPKISHYPTYYQVLLILPPEDLSYLSLFLCPQSLTLVIATIILPINSCNRLLNVLTTPVLPSSNQFSIRGVKIIFTGDHISFTVAFKGPNVTLGLYNCNYSLTRGKELGTATG